MVVPSVLINFTLLVGPVSNTRSPSLINFMFPESSVVMEGLHTHCILKAKHFVMACLPLGFLRVN